MATLTQLKQTMDEKFQAWRAAGDRERAARDKKLTAWHALKEWNTFDDLMPPATHRAKAQELGETVQRADDKYHQAKSATLAAFTAWKEADKTYRRALDLAERRQALETFAQRYA